jgi:putative ABC transport system ATP-binding protein
MLLLADEPTGNLDSHTGAEIIDLLLQLRSDHGMTVIIATHDAVVASACERIIRLRDGRIADELTVPHDRDLDAVLERISRLDPTA